MAQHQARTGESLLNQILSNRPDLGITFIPSGFCINTIKLMTCGKTLDQYSNHKSDPRTGSHVVAKCSTFRGFEQLLDGVTLDEALNRLSQGLHDHVMLKAHVILKHHPDHDRDGLITHCKSAAKKSFHALHNCPAGYKYMCIPHMSEYVMAIMYLLDLLPGATTSDHSLGGNREKPAIDYLCARQFNDKKQFVEHMRNLIDHRLDGQTTTSAIMFKFLAVNRIIQMFGYHSPTLLELNLQQSRPNTYARLNTNLAALTRSTKQPKPFNLDKSNFRMVGQTTTQSANLAVAPVSQANKIQKNILTKLSDAEKKEFYTEIIFPDGATQENTEDFEQVLAMIATAEKELTTT